MIFCTGGEVTNALPRSLTRLQSCPWRFSSDVERPCQVHAALSCVCCAESVSDVERPCQVHAALSCVCCAESVSLVASLAGFERGYLGPPGSGLAKPSG